MAALTGSDGFDKQWAYYNLILTQVRHENDLLNHRVTWMWTLQGLLFTTFGLLVQENFPAFVICWVGLVSCMSIGFSLRVSHRTLDRLNECLDKMGRDLDGCPQEIVTVTRRGRTFLLPWIALPWFLTVVWTAMAAYTLR